MPMPMPSVPMARAAKPGDRESRRAAWRSSAAKANAVFKEDMTPVE
jgi:hypothetical protein